ncbi:MAG TPA: glycosyltransferase, partial [Candidatus Rubrimentiphilum sp.]|nr:glycosyltransferase [Candidatus Rubrimentiphilum sp.]
MRVALVHDYLNQRGGAERVFAHIANAFPDAPVYTALYDARVTGDLVDPARVRASFLNRLPESKRYFRYLAPLYPRAFESFDFSDYDTIVSSTTAWAKGITIPPGAVHICYINTVSRFTFAYDRYVAPSVPAFGFFAHAMTARLAEWDIKAAQKPTALIANSRNVADRIARYYHRDSTVLHCPVDLARFEPGTGSGDYFIVASRLLPYKRIDLAIEAAKIAGVPLVVTGSGPDAKRLRALAAASPLIRLTGYVSDSEMTHLFRNARAALIPGEEDFGLVPLEAAAAGRPAIAYRSGGALETIIEGETGEFFDDLTPASLAAMLRAFDARRYDRQKLRAHAETFAPEHFVARLRQIV